MDWLSLSGAVANIVGFSFLTYDAFKLRSLDDKIREWSGLYEQQVFELQKVVMGNLAAIGFFYQALAILVRAPEGTNRQKLIDMIDEHKNTRYRHKKSLIRKKVYKIVRSPLKS